MSTVEDDLRFKGIWRKGWIEDERRDESLRMVEGAVPSHD